MLHLQHLGASFKISQALTFIIHCPAPSLHHAHEISTSAKAPTSSPYPPPSWPRLPPFCQSTQSPEYKPKQSLSTPSLPNQGLYDLWELPALVDLIYKGAFNGKDQTTEDPEAVGGAQLHHMTHEHRWRRGRRYVSKGSRPFSMTGLAWECTRSRAISSKRWTSRGCPLSPALLYFLPFSVQRMRRFVLSKARVVDLHRMWAVISDYIQVIAKKYPYWNNKNGADHFIVACHDRVSKNLYHFSFSLLLHPLFEAIKKSTFAPAMLTSTSCKQ
ncbi:hypothetical protein EJ110_NYTH47013 [Nymphaea thermarum]|nr:hypothetical protein EJ110_NYTH47013 [Nymphaea thermarum]